MRYILFTTTSCPKCPAMKEAVAEQMTCPGEVLNEKSPGFGELAMRYEVQGAPTLVVLDDAGDKVAEATDPSELMGMLKLVA